MLRRNACGLYAGFTVAPPFHMATTHAGHPSCRLETGLTRPGGGADPPGKTQMIDWLAARRPTDLILMAATLLSLVAAGVQAVLD